MDPHEISRLADKARQKKKKQDIREARSVGKKPFNPFDWMDFKNTRAWISKNLALGDKFYSVVVSLLLAAILFTYFYFDDGENWAYYLMIGSWIGLALVSAGGFVYGFIKARKNEM